MSSMRTLLAAAFRLTGCNCGGTMTTPDGGDAMDAAAVDGGGVPDGGDTPDGETRDGGSGELPLDALCEAAVRDICRALIECYGAPYRDVDHCVGDFECDGYEDLVAEVEMGWLEYDGAAAQACHERFDAAPCEFGFFLFTPTIHQLLARCGGVLTGQQDEGEPCRNGLDCVAGLFCQRAPDVCQGVCEPLAGLGEACSAELPCDPELACRDGMCREHLVAGDPCDVTSSSDCFNDGFWCDVAAGTCRDPVGLDEVCNDFDGPRCADGLDCLALSAFDSGTCVMPIAEGDPCTYRTECVDPLACYQPEPGAFGTCRAPALAGGACAARSDCQDELRCVDTMCQPLAALGEPCVASFGADHCADGLVCADAVCRDERYPGEPCDDGSGECIGALCVAGTCALRARLFEACTVADDCASRRCEAMVCVDRISCL